MCEEVRMNIRIPEHVRKWYKAQSQKYNVPYTNYISMLLIQIYERETEKEVMRDLTEVLREIRDAAEEVNTDDLREIAEELLKEFIQQLKKMDI